MVCPHCGNGSNPDDANFCEECGGALEEAAASAAAEPVPVAAGVTETVGADPPVAPASAVAAPASAPEAPPPAPPRSVADGETQALDAWTCVCGHENPAAEAYCA